MIYFKRNKYSKTKLEEARPVDPELRGIRERRKTNVTGKTKETKP